VNFDEFFKNEIEQYENSFDDTEFTDDHIIDAINKYKQFILEKENSFVCLILQFRNWIKDFILEATKVLYPLISMDKLNSVQFNFNEKGTSLESFKKYVDAQNSTFMKIMSDYQKVELDQSEDL